MAIFDCLIVTRALSEEIPHTTRKWVKVVIFEIALCASEDDLLNGQQWPTVCVCRLVFKVLDIPFRSLVSCAPAAPLWVASLAGMTRIYVVSQIVLVIPWVDKMAF